MFKIIKAAKKLAVIIAVTFFSASIVLAQGNNWKLTGNNNVDGTDFIGTTIDKEFRIFTSQ